MCTYYKGNWRKQGVKGTRETIVANYGNSRNQGNRRNQENRGTRGIGGSRELEEPWETLEQN